MKRLQRRFIIVLNCVSKGMAAAITFVMFNTNRNNLSDLVEWRKVRCFDGMIGTADDFSSKSGKALAAKLLTGSLVRAGYDASLAVQPESAINAINAMLGWVLVAFGIGIIIVVLFINIDSETEKNNREKIVKMIVFYLTSCQVQQHSSNRNNGAYIHIVKKHLISMFAVSKRLLFKSHMNTRTQRSSRYIGIGCFFVWDLNRTTDEGGKKQSDERLFINLFVFF